MARGQGQEAESALSTKDGGKLFIDYKDAVFKLT